MVKVLAVEDMAKLVSTHGFSNFLRDLITQLKADFVRWEAFNKIPRPAFHVEGGVIELMPIADHENFSFKYVNGHPNNPKNHNKQTVIATGQLSRVDNGYPLLFSEMTLLTALRTAATSALATDIMARQDASTLAIIGTGAQSEFQVLSHLLVRNITTIQYYDIDANAMSRFKRNLIKHNIHAKLIPCQDAKSACQGADIITVCTACKDHVNVVLNDWVKAGVHINGLGGDCPGKTELEKSILSRAKVVVEFFEQSFIEGEIQFFSEQEAKALIFAELAELIEGSKVINRSPEDITVFDSVGFALEDFCALKLTHRLIQQYPDIGVEMNLVPQIEDPKDLFSVLRC